MCQQDVTEAKYLKRSEVSAADTWAQHLDAALRTDQHRAARNRRTTKALLNRLTQQCHSVETGN